MNDEIELILARLSTMPDNIVIHIGNSQEGFDKEKLIEHVKKQDKIGKMFVDMYMDYIKATIKGF